MSDQLRFDRQAGVYEDHAAVQREMAAGLAGWLPPEPGSGLEFGAGTGLLTRCLRHLGPQLLATDLSPAMVAEGRRRVPEVHWRQVDACHPAGLPIVRWILSASLLQWLPEPCGVLRRWRELCHVDGGLLAGWFVEGTLREFRSASPIASPVQWRTEAEWLDLLREAGWHCERHEVIETVVWHPSAREVLGQLHGLGAVTGRRLGAGQLRRLLRDYEAAWGTEQGVPATFRWMRVRAFRETVLPKA